jgi:hypothetical protein
MLTRAEPEAAQARAVGMLREAGIVLTDDADIFADPRVVRAPMAEE